LIVFSSSEYRTVSKTVSYGFYLFPSDTFSWSQTPNSVNGSSHTVTTLVPRRSYAKRSY
jgi:hypothetical protein